MPDDLESLNNDELANFAYEVGAFVIGDQGREAVIRRIRRMSL